MGVVCWDVGVLFGGRCVRWVGDLLAAGLASFHFAGGASGEGCTCPFLFALCVRLDFAFVIGDTFTWRHSCPIRS